MYSFIRPLLFQLSPETAHHVSLEGLRYAYQLGLTKFIKKHSAPVNLMGLTFPNRVGLAAGLDKNGDYIQPLSALGFGFVEIGTLTPKPQPGNLKPRLFRLVKEKAIINRMGFNNKGLDYAESILEKLHFDGILGINIGKNKDTSLDHAIDDYLQGFQRMAPYASYITINISSPNTPGLRDLQQGDYLRSLLHALKQKQLQLARYVPLVVKVAPDLSQDEINDIAEVILAEKMDGLIATNTTIERNGVEHSRYANEAGGLSGQPILKRSTRVVQQFHHLLRDQLPIIACGGIFSVHDAMQKYSAGAQLLQVYTGLIYQGPQLIRELAGLVP